MGCLEPADLLHQWLSNYKLSVPGRWNAGGQSRRIGCPELLLRWPDADRGCGGGEFGDFRDAQRPGARGIDFISTSTSSGTNVAYPIYDGHGNMVATLAKNGSGYTIGNRRSFGAWGEIRQGAATGSPNGRYCANLGHLDDDESGFTYMRARHYEASRGRFISSDPNMEGLNWFVYCDNDPINFTDYTGKEKTALALLGAAMAGFLGYLIGLGIGDNPALQVAFAVVSGMLSEYFSISVPLGKLTMNVAKAISSGVGRAFQAYCKGIETMYKNLPPPGIGMILMIAVAGYSGVLYGELFAQDVESFT